jgi:hypothetical protein
LTGETDKSPRDEFFYFSDDGDLLALRYDNWKMVFMEQRVEGTCQIWAEPFVTLRVPSIFNLRTDPFEFAHTTSNTYWDWMFDHYFPSRAGAASRGQVPGNVQGFPPAPEGSELHR